MRRTIVSAGLTAVVLAFASPTHGHTKQRALKEIVRIQGTVLDADGRCEGEIISIHALNRTFRLCCAEVRRIAVATTKTSGDHAVPAAFELHGERERLFVLSSANSGDRVTVLGEWRPGAKNLFLIALDVCACNPSDEGQ